MGLTTAVLAVIALVVVAMLVAWVVSQGVIGMWSPVRV